MSSSIETSYATSTNSFIDPLLDSQKSLLVAAALQHQPSTPSYLPSIPQPSTPTTSPSPAFSSPASSSISPSSEPLTPPSYFTPPQSSPKTLFASTPSPTSDMYHIYKKPSRPVIFFDWDDTLFPSSTLHGQGVTVTDFEKLSALPVLSKQIDELQVAVTKLLLACLEKADVYIITNAEIGWVEVSCKCFFPGLFPLVSTMNVLSARTAYENIIANDSVEWKRRAFLDLLSETYTDLNELNLVSIGDSQNERQALLGVRLFCLNNNKKSSTKSIKFIELPDVEQLKRQVEMIHVNLSNLVAHGGDLDLMLTIRPEEDDEAHPQDSEIESPCDILPEDEEVML